MQGVKMNATFFLYFIDFFLLRCRTVTCIFYLSYTVKTLSHSLVSNNRYYILWLKHPT